MNTNTVNGTETDQGAAARQQAAALTDWLPENHAAVRAAMAALKDECTQARQRLTDKPTFERLNAWVTATTAALWVLDRTPADLRRQPAQGALPRVLAAIPFPPVDQPAGPGSASS